jgi:YihY family inner membrane protein
MSMVTRTVRSLDMLQQRNPWLAVLVAVAKKFSDDQAGNLAALIAYYAFVAIFPLLLVLVTVLDIVLKNHPALRQSLVQSALAQYPVIGPQLVHNIGPLHRTGLALVVGLLAALFGARGLATATLNALNSVWEIPIARRPRFPGSWVRSVGLILLPGLGLLATTTLSVLASGAGRILTGGGVTVTAFVASLVLNIGLFWLAFRLGTVTDISSRQLLPGAVISAATWQILQAVGGYLVSHQLVRASPSYGIFAIVLGLLAWLFLQAELTLYAVEFNVVRAYRLWPRSIAPPPYTKQDRQAFQLYAQVERRGAGIDIVVEDTGPGGEDDRPKTSG